MKIFKQIQKITEYGLSTRDRQREINVSEVFHLWNHLSQRYNVIHITNIFKNFATDDELKVILDLGIKILGKHVAILEKEMTAYAIPLPLRPPKQVQCTTDLEALTDRHIFRRVSRGIQSFLPTHTMAFIHSNSAKIRELFMLFLIEEMKLYDKMAEYGRIKSYEITAPVYRN